MTPSGHDAGRDRCPLFDRFDCSQQSPDTLGSELNGSRHQRPRMLIETMGVALHFEREPFPTDVRESYLGARPAEGSNPRWLNTALSAQSRSRGSLSRSSEPPPT